MDSKRAGIHAKCATGLLLVVPALPWTLPARAEAVRLSVPFTTDISVQEEPRIQAGRLLRAGRPWGSTAAPGTGLRLGPPTLQFEGGDTSQRRVRIVADSQKPDRQVLEFEVVEPNVTLDRESGPAVAEPSHLPRAPRAAPPDRKARVQMNVYGNDGVAEVYQTVRMRLDDGFDVLAASPQPFDWLTVSEWWNNAGWTGESHAFRITLDVGNRGDDGRLGLFLHARATAKPKGGARWSETLWSAKAGAWSLPVRRWMTVETWFREGDAVLGRFVVAVTPEGGTRQVLVNVTNTTHHPEATFTDGLRHFNPLKLYTSQALVEAVRRSAPRLAIQWADLDIQACARAEGPSPCELAMGLR